MNKICKALLVQTWPTNFYHIVRSYHDSKVGNQITIKTL